MSEAAPKTAPSREQLLFMLYEAAELEHNLMCTYLYAAFTLKAGEHDSGFRVFPRSEGDLPWRAVIPKLNGAAI